MAKPVKSRKVVSKVFAKASESNSAELPKKLKTLQEYLIDAVENDCRHFASTIADWKDNKVYEHFNPTWEQFVAEHIKQPLEWIDHVIDGVSILDQTTPIKAQDAVAAAKIRAVELAQNPKTLNNKGGDYTSEQSKLSDYNQIARPDTRRGGTDPEYLAAKLAKDHPAILERVKAGEYPSIRAAAVAAGVVKPRKQFTVGHSTDPRDFALKLYDDLDRGFLVEVLAALNELVIP